MFQRFRNIPPICLLVSLFRIINGKLRTSGKFLGRSITMEDGSEYNIFRQITNFPVHSSENDCVFVVRFKFRHLSHKANRIVSIIPMLLIAGHPGFVSKCYAMNEENGVWQGMYQWQSIKDLELYKKSFVFKMINKRAIPETIVSQTVIHQTLSEFFDKRSSQKEDTYLTGFPILII